MDGRVLRTISEGMMARGRHSLLIEKKDLPAGAYLLYLRGDGTSAATMVEVR